MTETLNLKFILTFKAITVFFLVFIAASIAITTQAKADEITEMTEITGEHNGQVMAVSGQSKAWEASSQQWMSLDSFWQNWADSRGGITWGRSKNYPAYEQVKEQDTLLIELDSGTCLMEFWHSRWRRANDVRRWDDAFNTYSACNKVFD
ncbi:hypothetical protein Sps_05035 [Shewanella psychrophila]|uniref:Uncharacterized protein n=1 Tax=Shewanella psychrophila TaxID=225848 RepID=A0A1S6HX38_9GAMM|nr:hypothetical protein [Shewanella psychrophila]AQS40113.1 hypothetical protein Sps_05035 [Shewanella psychrophila]